jgi:hypothetical protein
MDTGIMPSNPSPFICPLCGTPVPMKVSQFDARGNLVHPECLKKASVKSSSPWPAGSPPGLHTDRVFGSRSGRPTEKNLPTS